MTANKGYGDHDKNAPKAEADADTEGVAVAGAAVAGAAAVVWKPPAKMPTRDAWRMLQGALNSCGLATPSLVVDGIPGPLTLAAAKGLVPLIEYAIKNP